MEPLLCRTSRRQATSSGHVPRGPRGTCDSPQAPPRLSWACLLRLCSWNVTRGGRKRRVRRRKRRCRARAGAHGGFLPLVSAYLSLSRLSLSRQLHTSLCVAVSLSLSLAFFLSLLLSLYLLLPFFLSLYPLLPPCLSSPPPVTHNVPPSHPPSSKRRVRRGGTWCRERTAARGGLLPLVSLFLSLSFSISLYFSL